MASTLIPDSSATAGSSSVVTPSTHAEAEAALEANSLMQTDAAGPITTRPAIPVRTNSNNYIDASLASGAAVAPPFNPKREEALSGATAGALSASSDSWRPRFDRQQSFKREDLQRLIQEGLLSPAEGQAYENSQGKPEKPDGESVGVPA